jgi:hypothetical protein
MSTFLAVIIVIIILLAWIGNWIPEVPACSMDMPISVRRYIPYNPKFLGYWAGENAFCIEGTGEANYVLCHEPASYSLTGHSNKFSDILKFAKASRRKYIAIAKYGPENTSVFVFNSLIYEPVDPSYHPKFGVPCGPDDLDKYCGCSDSECGEGNPARLWAVYQVLP